MDSSKAEVTPSTGEGPLALAIKRFSTVDSSSSSSDSGAAALCPTSRPGLGSDGNIDLSGLPEDSSDLQISSSDMRLPPTLVPASEDAPRIARSAFVAGDVLNGTASDVVTNQRELQLQCLVDSSTSDQRYMSHESSRSTSSSALAPFRQRSGEAAAPSPKDLDDAKVSEKSVRRRPPKPGSPTAPVTKLSAGSFASAAVVATVSDSKPFSMEEESLLLPDGCKRSGHRHGGVAACRASTQPPKNSTPEPAVTEARQSKFQCQSENAELKSPSSGRVCTTLPQRTQHGKKNNSGSMASGRASNHTTLYERGIMSLQKASAKREAMRAKLEEAALAEATFHPTLSPRASALQRSGDSAGADHEFSAQLRYRLHLLEMPDGSADAGRRHTPRISHTSEMIVRACRGRGGAELPPEERLYRDYFYRQQAIDKARMMAPSSAVVRSKRDIDAHIAGLHLFEQQRQRAISTARDALLSDSVEAHRRVYVDPGALVERLTKQPCSTQHRTAAAQLAKDQFSFHPQTSASSAEFSHQARLRGLHRWVRYFCGADILSLPVLSTFQGEAAQEASTLSTLLQRHSPTKTEWNVQELAEVFADGTRENSFIAELWRRRPPMSEGSATVSDLTYRPCLNPKSTMIVEKMNAEHRCGPTHHRLFLNARAKQLSQRQQELEEEQAFLEDKQRERQRNQRLQAAWRAQEAQRLEAYRAAKSEEQCKTATGKATAAEEPLHAHTTTCSRQPFLSSSSSQVRVRHRARVSPSSLTRQCSAAEKGAAVATPRSSTPLMSVASSNPSSEVARVREKNSGKATTARSSGTGFDSRSPLCPPPASHQMASSAHAAPEARCVISHFENTEDWSVPNKSELDRAAEALRDALMNSAHSCSASQKRSAPSSQHTLPAATSFTLCDVDCPRESQDKLHARSLDVLLACAQIRDPWVFPSGEREKLDKAQRRQLRELGRLLYSCSISNVHDRNST
ncbi:hypothetical protein, conserved [Leishmania tarentolae]|uniref:Uncharacterized protein n=1 Tax=Leishmania tarentolae TaxID=5689 RepID=A0A640KHD0_LEITA|nr:hypothetical protein, conserved [Leishmania tarentolae]